MRRSLVASIIGVILALLGCGGGMTDGSGAATNSAANLITISGMAFAPERLQVTPGATVTVRNMDSVAHSVTSETAMNDFRHGSMAGVSFDMGPFMGEMTFVIPPMATVGGVIPYFSSVDTSRMMTPNGEIEIVGDMPMPDPMPMPMPGMGM